VGLINVTEGGKIMAGAKAKKAAKAESELRDLTLKAIRRGDKLTRTLTQIVAQTKLDPSHPVHVLLKALEKGISKLRHHGETRERPNDTAKTGKQKAVTAASPASATEPAGVAKASRPVRARRIEKPEAGSTTEAPTASDPIPSEIIEERARATSPA
jgi:hypothetical protein